MPLSPCVSRLKGLGPALTKLLFRKGYPRLANAAADDSLSRQSLAWVASTRAPANKKTLLQKFCDHSTRFTKPLVCDNYFSLNDAVDTFHSLNHNLPCQSGYVQIYAYLSWKHLSRFNASEREKANRTSQLTFVAAVFCHKHGSHIWKRWSPTEQ